MRKSLGMAAALAFAVWGSAQAMDLSSVDEGWNANAAVAAECAPERPAATLVVGGAFNIAAYGRWAEGINGTTGASINDRRQIRSTAFEADTAALWFKVNANENNWLTVKLDLDDAWNNNFDQDDFLEEMYFTFNNIANTGFGVKVGKMEVPFGFDKDELLVHPYLHGNAQGAFNAPVDGNNAWAQAGMTSALGHGGYREFHSIEYDNLFAITPYWDYCDGKLLIEASLFQATRALNGDRRSADDMAFRSASARITWHPIENLMLQGSVITRFDDGSERSVARATDRMWATSLAAEYKFDLLCRRMNVFAEWQHSWNTAPQTAYAGFGTANANAVYMDDSSSDDIHFGVGYQLMEKLKLHLQGEWLKMRSDRRNSIGGAADGGGIRDADSTLWRAVIATEFALPGGITLESGFQYEWLKLDNVRQNYGRNDAKDKFGAATWYSGIKFAF